MLREIELRRGLNIVWARPAGENVAASRLAGHGAGKTTFCRLIRYVLDDAVAGSAEFRGAFEGKLGVGWVLAEIFVSEKRWLVGRPIMASSAGYHSFAIEGGALTDAFAEKPSRAGYSEYRMALDIAVFGQMKIRVLPDSRKNLDWPRLLQWLSRDQEAHLASLTEWRHKDSESGSPDISADDRANLIRLVLGLVESVEQDLLTKLARKASDHEGKVRDKPKLEFAVERERQALSIALEMSVGDPKDSVLQLAVSNRVENLINQSDVAGKSAEFEEEIGKLLEELAARQAEWGFAKGWISEIEEAVELEDAKLRGAPPPTAKPKTSDDFYRQSFKGLGPFPGYCSHAMDKARLANCPIAHERKPDDDMREAIEAVNAQAQPNRTKLEELRAELICVNRLRKLIMSRSRCAFSSTLKSKVN